LGLFEIGSQAAPSAAGRSTVGLYHLAWEVDTLAELERLAGVLTDAGALTGPRRACTEPIPTAWSSRSRGSSPRSCWTMRLVTPADASAGWIWRRRRSDTAP